MGPLTDEDLDELEADKLTIREARLLETVRALQEQVRGLEYEISDLECERDGLQWEIDELLSKQEDKEQS